LRIVPTSFYVGFSSIVLKEASVTSARDMTADRKHWVRLRLEPSDAVG
jgi:hypothetical protein